MLNCAQRKMVVSPLCPGSPHANHGHLNPDSALQQQLLPAPSAPAARHSNQQWCVVERFHGLTSLGIVAVALAGQCTMLPPDHQCTVLCPAALPPVPAAHCALCSVCRALQASLKWKQRGRLGTASKRLAALYPLRPHHSSFPRFPHGWKFVRRTKGEWVAWLQLLPFVLGGKAELLKENLRRSVHMISHSYSSGTWTGLCKWSDPWAHVFAGHGLARCRTCWWL